MSGRRKQLAARRVALGLTQEALAESLGVSSLSIRRWEAGTTKPRTPQRAPLADRLQITLPELERLLSGTPEVPVPDGHAVPSWLTHYASLEQGAARLQTVEPITIPGLLQTEDYARALMQYHYRPVSEGEVADTVRVRLARQAVLDREPDPLELHCIIDESVLNRQTGTPEVMAAQLDHLASVAAKPTVLIQVVPASGGVMHSASFGSFTLFTAADKARPYMACTEDLGSIHYQDSRHAIEAHTGLFDHLAAVALSPEQSAELILNQAERYR
jgi:transcriptional regulator with XRE-family HTH domain